jgi:hypothetical protein
MQMLVLIALTLFAALAALAYRPGPKAHLEHHALGWIILIALVLVAAASYGRLSERDETLAVGEGQVTFSDDPTKPVAERVRDALKQITDQIGLDEEYTRCVHKEIDELSDAELEDLVERLPDASARERNKIMVRYNNRFVDACSKPGRQQVIDDDISENERAVLREVSVRTVRAQLNEIPQLSAQQRRCLVEIIEGLPDEELIEMNNESMRANERRWVGYMRRCQ